MAKRQRRMPAKRLQALIDAVKDQIDELQQIKHDAQRRETAAELTDYLDLHYCNPY